METVQLRDFLDYRYPSALELSPDGKRLVFTVKSVDAAADDYRWELWLCELDGRSCAPLKGGAGLRRSVWMDNDHLMVWEQTADTGLLERGIEAVWTVLFQLDVRSGEKKELYRVPMAVTSVWPMEGGRCLLMAETRLDEPNLLTLADEAREQEITRRIHNI